MMNDRMSFGEIVGCLEIALDALHRAKQGLQGREQLTDARSVFTQESEVMAVVGLIEDISNTVKWIDADVVRKTDQ